MKRTSVAQVRRPAIPRAVRRRVLVQAGHRCAVCGDSCGLEIAHIIAWRHSKQHSEADLMCLCATCHQRADLEGWGEEVLRQYKETPWILRKKLAASGIETIAEICIRIDMSFHDFDERQERFLRHALASFLDISPSNVEIARKEPGSVNVFVRIPKAAGEALIQAFRDNAAGVRASISLPVTEISEFSDAAASTESWIAATPDASFPKYAEGKEVAATGQLTVLLQSVRERGGEEDYQRLAHYCQSHISKRAKDKPELAADAVQAIAISALVNCLPVITSEASSIRKAQEWLEAALNDLTDSPGLAERVTVLDFAAGKSSLAAWIGGALKLISDEIPLALKELSAKHLDVLISFYALDSYPVLLLHEGVNDAYHRALLAAWDKLGRAVEHRLTSSFQVSRKMEAEKAKRVLYLARQRPIFRAVRSRPKRG